MPSPEIDLNFSIQVPSQSDIKSISEGILRALAARYRDFVDEHFVAASRGEASYKPWKPLKKSTVDAKKRLRKAATYNKRNKEQRRIAQQFEATRILIFTSQLKNAVNPAIQDGGMKESYFTNGDTIGVKIGFTGKLHSGAGGAGGKMTIAKLAAIHQFGNPSRNLPARPILIEPSSAVKKQMENIIESELQGALKND